MTFESNFINHSKEYIFLENDVLFKNREKKYNKIIQKDYDKKNNESLKNINFSDLSIFDYYYQNSNTNPRTLIQENGDYMITIVNEN